MGDRRTRGLPAQHTERRLVKLATDAAMKDSTNPERIDCPGPEAVDAVVRRHHSFPDFDNIVDHIATCAPCFKEYSGVQSRRRVRRNGLLALACAAVIAVGVFWANLLTTKPRPEINVSKESPPAPILATLDYTAWTAVRSGNSQHRTGPAPKLTRGRLDLAIRLPIGTEDGRYTVEFRSGRDEPVLQITGTATWDGTAEVLKVSADLHSVPPGAYTLMIRSRDSSARSYPVIVE